MNEERLDNTYVLKPLILLPIPILKRIYIPKKEYVQSDTISKLAKAIDNNKGERKLKLILKLKELKQGLLNFGAFMTMLLPSTCRGSC